jgi:hypothetical protein
VLVEDLVSFQHAGIKVWMSCDLIMRAARDPVNACVIVDWKTGRQRDSDLMQIGQYGAWSTSKGWTDTTMLLVYLRGGHAKMSSAQITEEMVAESNRRIDEFSASLRTRLVNGDLHRNEAIESRFEVTKTPSECEHCQFQIICARDGTKPPPLDATPPV